MVVVVVVMVWRSSSSSSEAGAGAVAVALAVTVSGSASRSTCTSENGSRGSSSSSSRRHPGFHHLPLHHYLVPCLCDGYSRLARHPSLKGLRLRSWHLECGATSEASMLKPLNRGALFQDAASERPRLRGASPEAVEIHLAR